jgi:hypothetical protein
MSASKLTVKLAAPSPERIERIVLLLRGQKVLLDFHLAELYGVRTKVLNQAVGRNSDRFPEDFMFQLSKEETHAVMRSHIMTAPGNSSQFVMSSNRPKAVASNWSQIVTSSKKHRGLSYRPYAFPEQGVAMLSSVLRSPRAVRVNVEIMRAFVRLRQWLASNAELSARLDKLEKNYDRKFKAVFEAIRELMREDAAPKRKREIGFHTLPVLPGKSGAAATLRIN